MLEIDVTRFQHTHHLDAFNRFAVEGNTGGRDNLRDQSLQSVGVDCQNAFSYEIAQTVQQGIYAEKTLLCQRGKGCFILAE